MFDHVTEDDRREAARRQVRGVESPLLDVQAEALARELGREAGRLYAPRLPSAAGGLGQQKSDPAADVADRASPSVALDLVEGPRRRRPLARLLLEIGGLGDFLICLV